MGGGGEREREGEGDASGLGRRQRGEDGKVWAGWALPLPPLKALFFFFGYYILPSFREFVPKFDHTMTTE